MAAVAITLLLTAGVFAACQTVPLGSGPLFTGDARTESGGSWDVGTMISFGAPVVRNPTDDNMVIKEITLTPEHEDPGATVTAVYVLDLTGISEKAGLGVGFPPANQAQHAFVPAKGAILKPNTTYQVLFVVKVDKDGEWSFPSFDVTYEVNGRKHKATTTQGLRVCAPKSKQCDP